MFDDVDPEPTACMGMAKIPLISLANDKAIKGTFELKKVRQDVLHRLFVGKLGTVPLSSAEQLHCTLGELLYSRCTV